MGENMEQSKIKKFLTLLPIFIISIIVLVFAVLYFTKNVKYNTNDYEKRLSEFYQALSSNDTNKIETLTISNFINNEKNLPLKKKNYKLFSYKFEIITNELDNKKIEQAKLLFSIYLEDAKTNSSIIKEVYFSPDDKKLLEIKDIYVGKDITIKN